MSMKTFRFLAVFPIALPLIAASAPAAADPLPIVPSTAYASPQPAAAPVRLANAQSGPLGGGLLEALFGGLNQPSQAPRYQQPAAQPGDAYGRVTPYEPGQPAGYGQPTRPGIDPRFLPQTVTYRGKERPGTVIINTNERMLYLVEAGGTARRYGIGVGRPGFTWAGMKQISAKREWPDWRPPEQMLQRRPDLPRYMKGGPDNPLGARAMYLGSSLYRIHGSNEPWTIGQAVSSGCIRMRNQDVMDLYQRVRVGTRVIVI
jgi:lipoprotein-anchoring transpeptidase ErfK/SrfK